MKPRIQARELWLLLPFLGIGAFAFYLQRQEGVGASDAQGLRVSDFRVETAPGYWREKGYSHRVSVAVARGWRRPAWWGQCCDNSAHNDALHPQRFPDLGGALASETIVTGGTLTFGQGARRHEWPAPDASLGAGAGAPERHKFSDDQYHFEQFVKLSAVPQNAGAVSFRGLYNLADSSNLTLDRLVRAPGQIVTMNPDRAPGAAIVEASATPFFRVLAPAPGRPKSGQDKCQIGVIVRDMTASAASSQTPSSQTPSSQTARAEFSDIELHDAHGTIYPPPAGGMKPAPAGGPSFVYNRAPGAGEQKLSFALWMNRNFVGPDRLWMRGKISLDERWPLVFDFPLPPRSQAVVLAPASGPYSIALWRDGRPVKPKRPAP